MKSSYRSQIAFRLVGDEGGMRFEPIFDEHDGGNGVHATVRTMQSMPTAATDGSLSRLNSFLSAGINRMYDISGLFDLPTLLPVLRPRNSIVIAIARSSNMLYAYAGTDIDSTCTDIDRDIYSYY